MTGPPFDELEDDFLTVEQLAQLRQVTPAAIRAQLRAGNLAGEQVLQGQRTVWRIPVEVARRYLERSGNPSPAATGGRGVPPDDARPPAAEPAPAPAPVRAVPVAPSVAAPPVTAPSGRVEALEAEVRRLRRQLAALADAHRRLLDALTADGVDDRTP
ncbi:hypothetical protein ACI8AF_17375 [Blastococcus sp. SYSU D00669]